MPSGGLGTSSIKGREQCDPVGESTEIIDSGDLSEFICLDRIPDDKPLYLARSYVDDLTRVPPLEAPLELEGLLDRGGEHGGEDVFIIQKSSITEYFANGSERMRRSAEFQRLEDYLQCAARVYTSIPQSKAYNNVRTIFAQRTDIPSYFDRLCPNCQGDFPTIELITAHLNSPSTCWPSDARPQELPLPPAFRQGNHPTGYIPATGHCHPHSGYIFGNGKNMLDKLEDDEYAYRRKENTYYPFHDEAEWQLGKFLVENLTQTQIAKFLKLTWVTVNLSSYLQV